MMTNRFAAAGAAMALSFSFAPIAQASDFQPGPVADDPSATGQYALDDGSGGFNLGPSAFAAEMLWGNTFQAKSDAEIVTSISVSFSSSLPVGTDVRVLLFDDPTNDLDPSDGVLLTESAGLTEAGGPQTFQTFDIPDAQVSGTFFAAAAIVLPQGQSAARMDQDTVAGRSWIFFDDMIDEGNLGDSPLIISPDNTPFPGTFMVRANAMPIPAPGAAVMFAMAAGGVVIRRRR